MSYSITRRIECDIGHRIPDHASQCRNLHGHRYVIEATCSGSKLIGDGPSKYMVLDFSFLKDEMMKIIHKCCDHGLILSVHDPLQHWLILNRRMPSTASSGEGWELSETDFGKLYTIEASPTADSSRAPSDPTASEHCGCRRQTSRPLDERSNAAACWFQWCHCRCRTARSSRSRDRSRY